MYKKSNHYDYRHENQTYTEEWKCYCRRLGTTEIIHCELAKIL